MCVPGPTRIIHRAARFVQLLLKIRTHTHRPSSRSAPAAERFVALRPLSLPHPLTPAGSAPAVRAVRGLPPSRLHLRLPDEPRAVRLLLSRSGAAKY